MPMRASADAKDAMMAVGSLRRCFYSDGESDILFLQFCSSFRTLAERGDGNEHDQSDLSIDRGDCKSCLCGLLRKKLFQT